MLLNKSSFFLLGTCFFYNLAVNILFSELYEHVQWSFERNTLIRCVINLSSNCDLFNHFTNSLRNFSFKQIDSDSGQIRIREFLKYFLINT